MTNQYTPEDVPTVLRRMFSETIKLGESWEADGNRMLSDFEHGKFITESLDEWAYNFSALADEYEARGNFPSPEWKPFYDAHMATDCDHDPAREGGCEIEANCAFCGVEHYPTFHDNPSFRNNPSPRREWRDDWKDYIDDLAIPEDWVDNTWHNNELPSFIVNGYHIWMNSPRAEERKEHYTSNGEDWRFAVNLYNEEDGEIIYPERCSEGHGHLTGGEIPNCSDGSDPDVLRTLDFDELVAFVSKSRT